MGLAETVEQLANNILLINQLRDRVQIAVPKDIGITRSRVLMILQLEGRQRLKDLAAKSGISPSALCITFSRMEQEGLVVREVDSTDRRNTYYSVSVAGKEMAAKFLAADKQYLTQILQVLPKEEVIKLQEAIQTVNHILESWSRLCH